MERPSSMKGQFEESFMSNDHLPPLHDDDIHPSQQPQQNSTMPSASSLSRQQQQQQLQLQQHGNDNTGHHHAKHSNGASTSSIFSSLKSHNQIMAMLSNFSTSYNVVSISIVLPILSTKALYYQSVTDTSESICASALIAGMILGQLLGGALGDLIGRMRALYLVMSLQILASLSSAFLVVDQAFWVGNRSIFEQLAFWRLLLGIGCGGVYPLAALLSSEVSNDKQSQVVSSQELSSQREQGVILHNDGHGDDPECINDNDDNMNGGMDDDCTYDDENMMRSQVVQERNRLKMLAITFSTQGLGFVSVPIVGIISLMMCGKDYLDLAWRLILAVGSLPGITLMYLRWKEKRGRQGALALIEMTQQQTNESLNDSSLMEELVETSRREEQEEEGQGRQEHHSSSKSNLWAAIQNEQDLVLKLIGTAGTWFLFDVVFYGNTLFQPVVVKTAFGYDNDNENGNNAGDEFSNLIKNVRDSMILSSIALPGYFVSVALIGSRVCFKYIQTPRFIQIQGFAWMAVLYFMIGFSWDSLIQHHWLLIFLYGSTFFFSNYGPNTTTFMLPSLTFSPECRSTLNGISAASGKAGALVGSIMFEPVVGKYGDATVMCLCAWISIFAGIITMFCTRPPRNF